MIESRYRRSPPDPQSCGSPIAEALATIRRSLSQPTFDPAETRRTFTIAASDYAAVVVLPPFIAALRAEAPGVDLQLFPVGRVDLTAQLDGGNIDLAVGWFDHVPARLFRAPLCEEDEVLVVAAGSPLTVGKLTMQRLLEVPHIIVDYTGLGEAGETGFLDERGLKRRTRIERGLTERTFVDRAAQQNEPGLRIGLTVPNFLMAPELVACSGMVATLPRRFAKQAATRHDIALLEPPYDHPPVLVEAVWHELNRDNTAHRWARELLRRTSGTGTSPLAVSTPARRPAPAC
jgi:DNA-binding transcriptional LysR family regulator